MKIPSLLLLAALAAAAPSARAQSSNAGQFDSYTLSLSWQPEFCEGKPGLPECRTESAGRFDAANLSLHGLWPDVNGDSSHAYGYCGVDAATRGLDKAPTWCRLPAPTLSDATRAALTTAMPGAASCLDHHEWVRHGTCSGLSADAYFALAASLVKQVAATSFGQFLSAHAGKTVSADDALAAFESDLGKRTMVSLNCATVRGASALSEVRLHLPASLAPGAKLKTSLIATGDRGNCPASFLLDPVAPR
jgi:ribonuclease T2